MCTGVPPEVLQPHVAWGNEVAYSAALTHLARLFVNSFKQYLEVREQGVHMGVGPAAAWQPAACLSSAGAAPSLPHETAYSPLASVPTFVR